MKKIMISSVAGLAMLALVGCTGAPTIEFGEASPTPTPTTPTPEPETFTPEPQSDLDEGIDSVHVLTGGMYGSGSTYTMVGELLQMICWTLDDARSVDDAMDIIFDAGDDAGITTKNSAAFIYSATTYVCPEWKVAVQNWSNS